MKNIYDSITDLMRQVSFSKLEVRRTGHISGEIVRGSITFRAENRHVSKFDTITLSFCSAVTSVFVSLDLAFRATRAASHGDHEEAKKIVLKQ